MQKPLKILIIVLLILLIATLTDLFSILLFNKPILAIKDNSDTINIKYTGIFYDTYKCINEEKPKIKLKGTKYTCPPIEKEYIIIDTSQNIKDFACSQALEEIYKDTNYIYYLNCIKSDYIIVKYNNNKEERVKEALENKNINIEDLKEFNIDYIKEKNY